MDVIEIRNRKIGECEDDGCEDWEQKTVLHRDTTPQKVRAEYYPNYKLIPHGERIDADGNPIEHIVPRSLNPKVQEVHHWDIVPQKEKRYDPHAPAQDVESELIEVPR